MLRIHYFKLRSRIEFGYMSLMKHKQLHFIRLQNENLESLTSFHFDTLRYEVVYLEVCDIHTGEILTITCSCMYVTARFVHK